MRAAIYARFSSDLQNPKSADDQLVECKAYVERTGGKVVLTFKDERISGASIENRPQLQALISNATSGVFDAVVVENLDRLSRNVGDLDNIRRRLDFHKVKLISLADGEANQLTVGIRGIIGAAYLEDLKQKTKRGQLAALRAGKIAGGRCYGYDVAPGGKGERSINSAQAAVVQRIFDAYASGDSADEIARVLNAEGVPSPKGKAWRANTIIGGARDNTGVLRNELYRGVFVFNRHEYVKSPDTGRRLSRHNDPSQWVRQSIPELRIIDERTWEKVQKRLAARSTEHGAAKQAGHMTRKPPRLLSGLLRCGCCGGALHIVRDDRAQCIEARSGACPNTRMVSMGDVEARVISAVRARLLSPEVVEHALTAAREEMARLREDENRKRRVLEKELQDVERRLKALLRAIEESDDGPLSTLVASMAEAEKRKAEVKIALEAVPEQKIELHPAAVARYRNSVADLWAAVRRPDDVLPGREAAFRNGRIRVRQGDRSQAVDHARVRESGQEGVRKLAREALRALIDRVVVTPDGPPTDKRGGGPVSLVVHGQLAALMSDSADLIRMTALVAGAHNHLDLQLTKLISSTWPNASFPPTITH